MTKPVSFWYMVKISELQQISFIGQSALYFATVYKGNIIKNLIMDCQSYTKYRPNETSEDEPVMCAVNLPYQEEK